MDCLTTRIVLICGISPLTGSCGGPTTDAPPADAGASDSGFATSLTFTTFAGSAGSAVNAMDGTGTDAQFDAPRGIAIGADGTLFVADSTNHTIRRINVEGVVTTFVGLAGSEGREDGLGSEARFVEPWGVAVDGSGNVYVADTSNNAIRKISPAGEVMWWAGDATSAPGSSDGTGAAASFDEPRAVAASSDGTLYVADYENETIRKISPEGVVTTIAGSAGVAGDADGPGATARFRAPMGVAVDAAGNVYVADTGNRVIRKITPAGVVSTLAGSAGLSGDTDGLGSVARFAAPRGVAVDASGNVFVADYEANTIRMISPAGLVSTLAGSAPVAGTTDAASTSARFYEPSSIAVDASGNLFVADTANDTIRKITSIGSVSTFAGLAGRSGSADGVGADAVFDDPYSVAVGPDGAVYVVDVASHIIRKITVSGEVTTLAGTAGQYGSADGTGADARFFGPMGIGVGPDDVVYVADTGNGTIRTITPDGVVTTLAGTAGMHDIRDGTGTDAHFGQPLGLDVDSSGTLYVVDTEVIRKITAEGEVSTLAGAMGSPGLVDGTGTEARFLAPFDLSVGSDGMVYVCDHGNHAIRSITPEGVVTTLAGTGSAGSDDGEPGSFRYPSGISAREGRLFVADTDNQEIREIDASSSVTTVGGSRAVGATDGVGTDARFHNPRDVAFDGVRGLLYVADRGNRTIRVGTLTNE